MLLGQPEAGACRTGDCPAPTHIRSLESSYDTEAYELTYATPATPDGLRLRAAVDWAVGGGRWRVSVSALAFDDAAAEAEVWLDDVRLGTFQAGPGAAAQPALRRSFPAREVGHLRSFRYTVRHATQLAWLHAVGRSDDRRADALARFMLAAGFVPGRDLRAAIFGRGRDAPRLQLPPRAVPGRLRRLPAGAAGHSPGLPLPVQGVPGQPAALPAGGPPRHPAADHRGAAGPEPRRVARQQLPRPVGAAAAGHHLAQQDRRRAGAALRRARLRDPALQPARLRPGAGQRPRTFAFGMLETVLGYPRRRDRPPAVRRRRGQPGPQRPDRRRRRGPDRRPGGLPPRPCGAASSPTGTATAAT